MNTFDKQLISIWWSPCYLVLSDESSLHHLLYPHLLIHLVINIFSGWRKIKNLDICWGIFILISLVLLMNILSISSKGPLKTWLVTLAGWYLQIDYGYQIFFWNLLFSLSTYNCLSKSIKRLRMHQKNSNKSNISHNL